jgi:hypothetical protein
MLSNETMSFVCFNFSMLTKKLYDVVCLLQLFNDFGPKMEDFEIMGEEERKAPMLEDRERKEEE